jgi:gag-polypeptide of LTR copia-type/Zinc knuckle
LGHEKPAEKLENVGETAADSMQVDVLFKSLSENKEYDGIVTALRTREDVTWGSVTARLVEEHRRRTAGKSKQLDKDTFERAYAGKMRGKDTRKCWRCGKIGHIAVKCQSTDERPSDDEPRTSKTKIKHERGSTARGREKTKSDKSTSPRIALAASAFTAHEWHGRGHENALIVDSGASWHMCKDKALLRKLHRVPRRQIALGNNGMTPCDKAGSIDLVLENKGE